MYECHAKFHLLYLWPDERDHDDVPEVGVQPEGPDQGRGGEHPHLEWQSHRPRGRRTTRGTSSWTQDKTSSSPSPSRARGARDVTSGRTGRLPGEPARGGAPYLPRRDSCGTATLLHGGGFDYVIVVNLIIFINKFMLRALLFFFEPILSHMRTTSP